ncbi:FtsW/RodA/SpoVE family cell cycle protein [Paenibacillus flagellatus]|uniref:Cell division protein n=1 Tax=Paenibacillus flagellatus TaxID=2211139 RepID=A0A2V5K667_9BACL|nr:FtsW/RodA/SpoVE family cell cycle protein [Paenibacillus flagellatus]PYI54875.1 hypothetical protein DLM86_10010 [Paenibacillus flagellatus]
MIRDHESVRGFLQAVCSQIKAKAMHDDIRRELEGHIEELVAEREAFGDSRDEAIRHAIACMGDPVDIGKQMHRIHRPRMNGGLLAAVSAITGFGLFAIYAVGLSMRYNRPELVDSLFSHKFVSVIVGFALLLTLSFLPYRKLSSYSWAIYALAVGGLIVCRPFGVTVNGSPSYFAFGSFGVDWAWFATYLLLVAAAGLLMEWRDKPRFWTTTGIALVVVPTLLFAGLSRLPCLALYLTVYTILCAAATKSRWKAIGQTLLFPAFMLAVALPNRADWLTRLTAFLYPDRDPLGAGYMNVQLEKSIRAAGWFGNGFAVPVPNVPDIHGDYIFAYLVYSFGWAAGIALAGGFALLCWWMIRSARRIRDGYGRLLVTAAAALLGIQTGYNLLMSLGAVPIVGIPLPFVSYGFSHLVLELSAIGLSLAVFRTKTVAPAENGLRT